jgi:hypothetical protein
MGAGKRILIFVGVLVVANIVSQVLHLGIIIY